MGFWSPSGHSSRDGFWSDPLQQLAWQLSNQLASLLGVTLCLTTLLGVVFVIPCSIGLAIVEPVGHPSWAVCGVIPCSITLAIVEASGVWCDPLQHLIGNCGHLVATLLGWFVV